MRGKIGMMSQLETCDLCHEIHPLRKVHFDGHQFLCRKCRETPKVASNGIETYCIHKELK